MQRKFDTFIFDLDGTLLDTLPDLMELTNFIMRELGFCEHSRAEVLSYVGNGARRLIYQAVPADTPEAQVDAAMALWEANFADYSQLTRPFDQVEATLAALRARGCGLAVVSNKLHAGVLDIMGKVLPGAVDFELGEGPDTPRKPDPTGILRAMKAVGGTPESSVYVGDSPGDVRAARNAGMFAVGVSWGYHAVEDFAAEGACPDLMIDNIAQLLDLAK
jgi:phosphoglycolate phosphatase